jgi:hypothetical protein
MTDKEAMAMALDALETEVSIDWTNNDEFNASAEKMHEAITALKERLTQSEQTEVQQLIALVRAQQITIDKLEMALADHPMREVQRLGQEIEQEPATQYSDIVSDGGLDPRNKFDAPPQRTEQEPVCPACKAEVLYECVACSSNNYPPKD